jgi:hypothetical protein
MIREHSKNKLLRIQDFFFLPRLAVFPHRRLLPELLILSSSTSMMWVMGTSFCRTFFLVYV